MNISILAAGAGGMYCGSCMRDNALAATLRRAGHSVTLIPLYTPLRTEDTPPPSHSEIFYGGVNVYLQHFTRVFRHTPRMLDWVFDRPWVLNTAGRLGVSTPPEKLAGLTLDILQGEEGAASKELHRLVHFLRDEIRPQVISLPNLMFVGMAGIFRQELGVPVVCEMTGEDIFLDAMRDADRLRVRDVIRARTADVSRFVATSDYYAGHMAEYLDLPREQIRVVHTGISAEYFKPREPDESPPLPVLRGRAGEGAFISSEAGSAKTPSQPPPDYRERGKKERTSPDQTDSRLESPHHNGRPPTVGYLARICMEKGLSRLIDAMVILRKLPGMADVRLKVAGYIGGRDRKWYEALQTRAGQSGLGDHITWLGEVDREAKLALLDSIDVFSVPTAYPEAKGIYVLEAMARGVPVVQPAHGSFPELIERTGGGVLVPPGNADALARALADLLSNPARRRQLGAAGREAVGATFTEEHMAQDMMQVFEELLGIGNARNVPAESIR